MGEPEALSKRMQPVCEGITAYSSPNARDKFLVAITCAAKDYLNLADPAMIAAEIRSLEKELRKGTVSPLTLLDSLSSGALELIKDHGEIPDFSYLSNAEEILDASRDLLGILTSSSKMVEQRSQRRTERVAIGQIRRGRPRHRREEFLVSRLATAYVAASGEPTTRRWSDEDYPREFEIVVALALNALNLDVDISAKKLVEHHIHNRNNPQ